MMDRGLRYRLSKAEKLASAALKKREEEKRKAI